MTCTREVTGTIRSVATVGRVRSLSAPGVIRDLSVTACAPPVDMTANYLTNLLENLLNGTVQLLDGRD